jgi:tripartite-type tricarboxylate transporter receptor subunit TctC
MKSPIRQAQRHRSACVARRRARATAVSEFVPGYEATAWWGVGAPKNTPADIIDKLNREINAGLADAKIKGRFADLAGTAMGGSPADFGKLIAEETEKWGKVVRAANIKVE